MGYSVTTLARSVKLKEAMVGLLREAFTPWPEIVDGYTSSFSYPCCDDGLINTKGATALGFNYSTAVGPEREYVFSVVRWAALRVGRRRRKFRGLNLDSPVSYWYPDGIDPQPVLVAGDWPDMAPDVALCSSLGVSVGYRTIRELAWYHIPDGTHGRITTTHHGQSSKEIKEALIEAGWDGAKETLKLIEAHIARLDALWTGP